MSRSVERRLLFSVTMADCEFQTFTVGGHGGSGKDTSNTGVRIIHRASGARGECREERSQKANKERAFRKMAESPEFKAWVKVKAAQLAGEPSIEELVERAMAPQHIRVETRDEKGRWVPECSS
jgi:protein subunit release factor B